MMTSARSMIAPFDPVARELFDELTGWPIFDPHSHIDPHRPAARNLNEILGYHYYTELAHATGMPADRVGPGLDPRTRSLHLAEYLERIDNTVQYSWLMEIARTFHVFTHDRIDPQTIGDLYDRALRDRDGEEWDRQVWKASRLEAVFLTNDFDDPLEGWDTAAYVPCLRTDDLVLKLHEPDTIDRLRRSTGVDVQDLAKLRGRSAGSSSVSQAGVPGLARSACHRTSSRVELCRGGLSHPFAAQSRNGSAPDEHEEIRTSVFWMLRESAPSSNCRSTS